MTNEKYRPDMPLSELWQTYVSENPRVRSEHTKLLMRITVTNYCNFLGRPATLADFSDRNFVAYAEYRKSLRMSPRTIERELSKLTTLWRWAAIRGWCEGTHFTVQKCAPPVPTAWSPEEMELLFKTAAEYRSSIAKLPAHVVLVAALRLAYDTGERAGALLAVHWGDIDLRGRWVTFRGETRKGGVRAADNVQRFSRKTRQALVALKEAAKLVGRDEERVFPKLHRTSFHYHLRQVLKGSGLPSGRHSMFHKIRRTHATHLYVLGGDPTQSLGHESDSITRGYYLDPRYARRGFLADLTSGLSGTVWRLFRRLRSAFGL